MKFLARKSMYIPLQSEYPGQQLLEDYIEETEICLNHHLSAICSPLKDNLNSSQR